MCVYIYAICISMCVYIIAYIYMCVYICNCKILAWSLKNHNKELLSRLMQPLPGQTENFSPSFDGPHCLPCLSCSVFFFI